MEVCDRHRISGHFKVEVIICELTHSDIICVLQIYAKLLVGLGARWATLKLDSQQKMINMIL